MSYVVSSRVRNFTELCLAVSDDKQRLCGSACNSVRAMCLIEASFAYIPNFFIFEIKTKKMSKKSTELASIIRRALGGLLHHPNHNSLLIPGSKPTLSRKSRGVNGLIIFVVVVHYGQRCQEAYLHGLVKASFGLIILVFVWGGQSRGQTPVPYVIASLSSITALVPLLSWYTRHMLTASVCRPYQVQLSE